MEQNGKNIFLFASKKQRALNLVFFKGHKIRLLPILKTKIWRFMLLIVKNKTQITNEEIIWDQTRTRVWDHR